MISKWPPLRGPRRTLAPCRAADRDGLAAAASVFRGLGDPSRLAILAHLSLGEHKVKDLTEHLGLAQSTVSEHLLCLLDLHGGGPRPRSSIHLHLGGGGGSLGCARRRRRAICLLPRSAVVPCPRYGTGALQ